MIQTRKVQVWVWDVRRRALLLLKTQPRGEYGSFWQPVTGKVEDGEDFLTAAHRELKEETGLTGVAEPLPYEFEFDSRWGGRSKESVFLVRVVSPAEAPLSVTIDPSEHLEFAWVNAADALGWVSLGSYPEILGILLKKLGFSV